MADHNISEREPHDKAEELLPWYVTGQLDCAERTMVEAHLGSCAECREQLALERRLFQEFRAMIPEVESGWSRLRARIDLPRQSALRSAGANFFAELWSLVSRPAIAGLALAQLLFLLVSASVLLSLSWPAYHTLGSAPVPASANVIVMFRADTTIEEVEASLKDAGASIVDGPTAADAYLLRVDPRQRKSALAKLKGDDHVQLAEPIDGGGS